LLTQEKFRQIDFIVPLFDVGAWSGFANQPTNDDIQVVSNNVADTGLLTLIGINNLNVFTTHTITLKGTTAVDSVLDPKWKTLCGAFLGDVYGKNTKAAVGTITIKEKSGGATITSIAATTMGAGLQVFYGLQGRDVCVVGVSGNLYLFDNGLATTANGYPVANTEKFNFCPVSNYFTLISDTSAATAKIIVWK
jgi:hypothetical protein